MDPIKQLIDRVYTHNDLEHFLNDEIWELIEGVPYLLAQPSVKHQKISMELSRQFANYLHEKKKPYKVFAAPFGVYLPNTNDKNNFIVPDLTVVCEPIEGNKYCGVPPLVIEIVHFLNDSKELQKKYKLYRKLGIKEYWLIDPDTEIISIFARNQNNQYEIVEFDDEERKIKVGIFEDLYIDFDLVF